MSVCTPRTSETADVLAATASPFPNGAPGPRLVSVLDEERLRGPTCLLQMSRCQPDAARAEIQRIDSDPLTKRRNAHKSVFIDHGHIARSLLLGVYKSIRPASLRSKLSCQLSAS